MKLNESFISYDSENDSVLVPVANSTFSGVVRGNRTFGFILQSLKEDITKSELFAYAAARTASARSFDRTLPLK